MSGVIYWYSVCGNSSAFWDYNLIWNTTSPRFPVCLQKTALVWMPCLVLWLLTPVEFLCFSTSRFQRIPWTVLNIAKLVLCALLFLLDLVTLIAQTTNVLPQDDDTFYGLDTIALIVRSSTLVLAFVLIVLGKRNGLISSGVLLIFWLIYSICGAVSFYMTFTDVFREDVYVAVLPYVVQTTYLPVRSSLLVLTLLPDATPTYSKIAGSIKVLNDEESASVISKVFFLWYDRVAWLGYRRPLTTDDLGALNYTMKGNNVFECYSKARQKDKQKQVKSKERKRAKYISNNGDVTILGCSPSKVTNEKPHLVRTLVSVFGFQMMVAVILKFMADSFAFTSPLLLSQLIAFVSSQEPLWHGYLFAVLLCFTSHLESLCQMHSFQTAHRLALRIRAALMTFIYNKALHLSTIAKAKTSTGEIVNLMSIDITKMVACVELMVFAFSAPFQVTVALAEIYFFLGPAALVGLATIVMFQMVSIFLARRINRLQTIFLKFRDERIKLMNEVLTGIKVLKLLAWEIPFSHFVSDLRLKELKLLKRIGILSGLNSIVWETSSFMISLAAFSVFVLTSENNALDASRAFVSITVFNILRRPLMQLPNVISSFVEASVSIKRLSSFASWDEISSDAVHRFTGGVDSVVIHNGCFSWGCDEYLTLTGVNFRAPEGSLVAVVGQVGSGKSSLLSAILGEMNVMDGAVHVKGDVAYAAQVPWIQNTTVKNNILFGRTLHSSNYDGVIRACAIQSDLELLPAGDLTEIGERGINLSGGQKHRVSLARTVYGNASVYLLDDPLSAVDVHVGKHIFNHVIGPKGLLAKKTRILVTHSVTYLPSVDVIVVMHGGTIREVGSFTELMDRHGAFASLIDSSVAHNERDCNSEMTAADCDVKEESTMTQRQLSRLSSKSQKTEQPCSERPATKDGKLVSEEGVETGKVRRAIFVAYLRSFGYPAIVMYVTIVLAQICNAGTTLWLSKWSSDEANPDGSQGQAKRDLRLGVYAALGFAYVFFMVCYTVSLVMGTMSSSRTLHGKMLDTVLRAPQWFFDVTPVGRILNRFSRDVSTVDQPLPQSLRMWQICTVQVATMFVVILVELPLLAVVAVPIVLVFFAFQAVQIGSRRQLQRIDSATRSPIYSLFSEVIGGATVIRAFGCEELFFRDLMKKIDINTQCTYLSMTAQRWLNIRLEIGGALFLLFAGVFAVNNRTTIGPGTVGLVISYTIAVTNFLKILFRNNSQLESDSISVERILEYCSLPREASWSCAHQTSDWPRTGSIVFRDYEARYRPELDTVLKGVTCTIEDKEKVGVVGRTGAGKSSITLALLRIIEGTRGAIIVDGVDISAIGLHNLRSKVNIIPQDPVLFSGTLRRNLDPFREHSDEQIWKAVELAHLKAFVSSLPSGIDYSVSEGGENLSVGQRQLVCLARSLLRKTKILILDEATAAVDLETDNVIQSTIRNEFKDCTVLTIAHRLNTIMDSDKIMVLDRGAIIEYDRPDNLLRNKDSNFYRMAAEANLV